MQAARGMCLSACAPYHSYTGRLYHGSVSQYQWLTVVAYSWWSRMVRSETECNFLIQVVRSHRWGKPKEENAVTNSSVLLLT
jgi:hypothetical protein